MTFQKWEGTPALTQSILQAILNVSPLSTSGSGSNRDSIQETEGACARLQKIQDKPKTFQNTGRHLELLAWPEWDPPPGGSCPCLCHLSWAILTNSALSYLGSSSLPWTHGILTASIPPKGTWSSLETKIDRRRRGETNTSVEQGSLTTNTQLTSDSKENTSKEIFLAGFKEGLLVQRILAAAAAGSTSTSIPGAGQHSWRVPSTEPKFHFLLGPILHPRGSQFGVTVTESCSFALQAGSQTLRHGRFVAEKGFIFSSHSSRKQENIPQIHLAKGQGFVTYMG